MSHTSFPVVQFIGLQHSVRGYLQAATSNVLAASLRLGDFLQLSWAVAEKPPLAGSDDDHSCTWCPQLANLRIQDRLSASEHSRSSV